MPFEKKPEDLGALWMRSSKKGDYMTGKINGVDVVCFPNKSTNPKAPQWRVLKSTPKTERPAQPADDMDF